MMHKHKLLPYFFILAFATVLVQALMFGHDSAGMRDNRGKISYSMSILKQSIINLRLS